MLTKAQVNDVKREVIDDQARWPVVFGALSDEGRYRIFRLLSQKKGLCVTDVAHVLGISVPAASQQLKIMELSGLVRKQRSGQMICYSIRLEDPVVKKLIKLIEV